MRRRRSGADGLAARLLARPPLNWTSQKLAQALNTLQLPKDGKGLYPSLDERRARVNEAYAAESARLRPNTDPASARSNPGASPPPAVQPVSTSAAAPPALRRKADQFKRWADARVDSSRAFPDGLLAGGQGMR